MNVLVIHQCSKGFLPRLISAFYLGSGTEAYWGEAKKFTFWPRLSPEAIDPVLCLGSVRTEAIGNNFFFLIHPFARSWLLQTAFKPKHKLHSPRVLDHPAFKPKHKLQESRTTQDHSISATFSPSISAGAVGGLRDFLSLHLRGCRHSNLRCCRLPLLRRQTRPRRVRHRVGSRRRGRIRGGGARAPVTACGRLWGRLVLAEREGGAGGAGRKKGL